MHIKDIGNPFLPSSKILAFEHLNFDMSKNDLVNGIVEGTGTTSEVWIVTLMFGAAGVLLPKRLVALLAN